MGAPDDRFGAGEILLTSMDRDGTKNGFDVALTRAISDAVPVPVIASGGITDMEDVRRLCGARTVGITGAITGRAIYEGTLDFAQGQALADELQSRGPGMSGTTGSGVRK